MSKVTQRQWYGGLVISFFLALLLTMRYASFGAQLPLTRMAPWKIISMAAVAQIGYLFVWRIYAGPQIRDLSHEVQSSEQASKEG